MFGAGHEGTGALLDLVNPGEDLLFGVVVALLA